MRQWGPMDPKEIEVIVENDEGIDKRIKSKMCLR